MNKHITAAATAAATLLAVGCGSQHPPASPHTSPAPAGATKASTVTHVASSPACSARLSAWQPAGGSAEHTLLHDADAAGADLKSLISQAAGGVQPSIGPALVTNSEALARTAKQTLEDHLPPSCVPHLRAVLTASMLNLEKQAADVNNASLALSDWNTQGAERLLKTASHDITAGALGINQATAAASNYQG